MKAPSVLVRSGALTIAMVLVSAAGVAWVPATATATDATVTLTAVDRFGGDADGDGALDDDRHSNDHQPAGVPVGLAQVGLRATLAAAGCRPGAAPTWSLDGDPKTPSTPDEKDHPCAVVFTTTPGKHVVTASLGTDRAQAHIALTDKLVVALGDSVASGEGNPDKNGWLEQRCHRSTVAGVEQAARLLGGSRSNVALTFISLACSGATIDHGLLGGYQGIERSTPALEPQVDRLARIQEQHTVDAVLISVGANDVNFGAVVAHCLQQPACPSARFDVTGKLGRRAPDADTVEEQAMAELPGRYARLAARLAQDHVKPSHVLLTEYFDPTGGANGQTCDKILAGGVSHEELVWAQERVLGPLNAAVAAAARAAGWQLVDGIAASFATHGYCAKGQSWIRRLGESILTERASLTHRADGTLHPNANGHLAIARRVAPPLAATIDLPFVERPEKVAERSWLSRNWGWLVAAAAVIAFLVWLKRYQWWIVSGWWRRFWALLRSGHSDDPVAEPQLDAGAAAAAAAPAAPLPPMAAAAPVAWPGVIRLGLALVAAILLGLLAVGASFVVGAAIVWARFWAARFPADQAMQAVGRGEYVAIGAEALGVFVALGAAAVVGLWVIDSSGSARRPTRRGLAVLVTLELLIAILLGGFHAREVAWLSAGFIVAALLLHYLIDRGLAAGLRLSGATSLWQLTARGFRRWRAAMSRPWRRERGPADEALPRRFARFALRCLRGVSQAIPLVLLLIAIVAAWRVHYSSDRLAWVVLPTLVAAILIVAPWGAGAPPRRLRRFVEPVEERLAVPRATLAAVVVICLIGLGVQDALWVMAAAAIAVALSGAALAVAHATGRRFAPFGAAVVLAVVLYGAGIACLRVLDSPQGQPMAAIARDGRAVCGLYVGERDGRVWLAHLQLSERGTHRRPAPRSSRLTSVLRADQVDVAVGPSQPVGRAQEQARVLRDQLLVDQGHPVDPDDDPPCEPLPTREPELKLVDQRDLTERRIAQRVQPELVVDRQDGFWPVSVRTIFAMEDRRARVCRHVADGICVRLSTASDLPFAGGEGEWLDYPADGVHTDDEHDLAIEALGSADPDRTATEYFLISRGTTPAAPWTAQFWFFYTFNYQPTTLKATADWIPDWIKKRLVFQPKAVRAGYHEGDFESVSLLLSARTHRPVYAWMARHKDEGRAYVWGEPGLQTDQQHMTVFAAKGSHADYASCVSQPRPVAPLGVIDDQPQCTADQQLRLTPGTPRLVDLSRTSWACWAGLFGAEPQQVREKIRYLSDHGPRSPLWQQSFAGVRSEPCRGVAYARRRDQRREEVLDLKTAKRLRAHAGRLDPVVDACSDWEHAPARGVLVVACDPETLDRFRASGYEDPGAPTVHIDVVDRRRLEPGPVTVPALRRDATITRLDTWRVATVATIKTTIYAACALAERNWAAQARFDGITVTRGHPLAVRDAQDGQWRLVDDTGRVVARAMPEVVRASSAGGGSPPDTGRCGGG
jgi:lysophospholipase L1-like esterase